jgi:hypothetical protein
LESMGYDFDISQNIDSREFMRKILLARDLEAWKRLSALESATGLAKYCDCWT